MWKLLLIPMGLYVLLLGIVFAFQGRLLFPAGSVGGAGPLPAGAERLSLETPDGHRLSGVHIPPTARPSNLLIIGFGGNAWNGETAAAYLQRIFPEADILVFHYRGYFPSTGRASARALLDDAARVYDFALGRFPGRRVVATGFSIGSGVAASLASRRPLDGVILVTPFDSLEAVAAEQFSWLPVRWLFRHEMNAAKWLRDSPVSIAIIAAERDTLITGGRTDGLRRAAARLVYDKTIPGAGHNDIYDRPEFRAAMREALARLVA